MQILNTALPELLLVGAARLLGIKKARLSSIKKGCAGDCKRCSSGNEKFPHAPLQQHKTIRRYLPQITPCSFPLERLLAHPATGVGVKSATRCRKTCDESPRCRTSIRLARALSLHARVGESLTCGGSIERRLRI